MLLRVRCKAGTWRVEGLTPQTTVGELKARVLAEHHVTPHPSQAFSLDPAGQRGMPEEATLEALGLRHGDLVHLAIREEDCAVEAGKKIAADGTIINKTHHEVASERGFRPGMRSLRSMKMHWTLTDFVELDSQVGGMERGKAGVCCCCCCWPTPTPLRAHAPTFNRPSPDLTLKNPHTPPPHPSKQFEYKIKAQKEPWCTKANMEVGCGNDFQSYMRRLNFEQCRMGYLYGSVDEKNEARGWRGREAWCEGSGECKQGGMTRCGRGGAW